MNKLDGQGLGWAKSWLPYPFALVYFVVRDEGISEVAVLLIARSVDQQGFTQREVMVLSDAHTDLHLCPPDRRSA
jgi:hypothetical protein